MLVAQLSSGIVDIPFTWTRYSHLKKHDFMDDLTVVAPQELLGGGPEVPQHDVDQIPLDGGA